VFDARLDIRIRRVNEPFGAAGTLNDVYSLDTGDLKAENQDSIIWSALCSPGL
jgi:hypothetical protein